MCLYNEPLYVRCAKVEVLRDIAGSGNVGDVIAELRDQATSGEPPLSKLALTALGDICARIPSVAGIVLDTLLELLEYPVEYINHYCILVLRDFLRVYPVCFFLYFHYIIICYL